MANIYRRGKSNVWWGRIQSAGEDIRRSLGTSSRAVAQKRFRDLLAKLSDAKWGTKQRREYSEAMHAFVTGYLPHKRPRAAERYKTSARNLSQFFKGKYLDEITSEKLAEFEAKRRADGVSDATIIRDLACLSSMFTHVQIDLEWVDVNPVQPFIRRRIRNGTLIDSVPRTRFLSHEEEVLILSKSNERMAAHVAFAIDSGLRHSEQFGLRWRDVDLPRNEVIVPAELGKGEKSRRVPLFPRSARILAQAKASATDNDDYVFRQPGGGRYIARGTTFKQLCQKIGLKDVTWHDLRRTCGCRLLQDRRMSMEEVGSWLGHSSVRVTETTYAFLNVDNLKKAARIPAQRRRTKQDDALAKRAEKAVN